MVTFAEKYESINRRVYHFSDKLMLCVDDPAAPIPGDHVAYMEMARQQGTQVVSLQDIIAQCKGEAEMTKDFLQRIRVFDTPHQFPGPGNYWEIYLNGQDNPDHVYLRFFEPHGDNPLNLPLLAVPLTEKMFTGVRIYQKNTDHKKILTQDLLADRDGILSTQPTII